jgi:hypothetical protein
MYSYAFLKLLAEMNSEGMKVQGHQHQYRDVPARSKFLNLKGL